jgi:hypothetical protein
MARLRLVQVDAARLMGKKIIAALIGIDTSQVPPDLTDEQFIDLTGDPDAYLHLKEGLKRAGLDPTNFPFPPTGLGSRQRSVQPRR